MDVSIIICTCNRVDELKKTLTSLGQVTIPVGLTCELLIIDNASTDATAQTAQEAHLPNMPVRYLYEGRPGKSLASNLGMANAEGEVMLFTDDDLRFPSDWIIRMIEPIRSGQAQAVAGGIQIAPHLERRWMDEMHRAWLAETAHQNKYMGNSLVGANMAVSKQVLIRVPQFDSELGPPALGYAEDSLFSRQIEEAGYTIADRRDVVVEHHFLSSRLSRRSFERMAAGRGRSSAYMMYHWEHEKIAVPQLQWVRKQIQLALWQRMHPKEVAQAEGMHPAEMHHIRSLALYHQIAQEQKQPRKYDKHGLIKKI